MDIKHEKKKNKGYNRRTDTWKNPSDPSDSQESFKSLHQLTSLCWTRPV